MLKEKRLGKYLPDTVLFEPKALWDHVRKYGSVILKPSGGGGGAGIIKLTRLKNGHYRVHSGHERKEIAGKSAVLAHIRSRFRPKPYLIQPYLSLGRINGRPFDVRVMLQRKKEGPWVVTGWLAKQAGPGFVVTNVARSRGKVLPLTAAVAKSNCKVSPELWDEMKEMSILVGERLGKQYPSLRMIGLDLGIDVNGRPWIIEANFRPSLSLFKKLPDLRAYRRIKRHRNQ
ncbi:YheC/YheD family protein [Brevibacillus ruminantium]|uniref:YheC/YheD family protein n=1 Tax=Brevibacillus ruminantium TaxID=2950604 RepID=A0ABY4WM26_9BACL|nr:YheC/YheD family protein [Brevibacillus ruminantium]USG68211.1 YheC/YheD family protein [Brevibacillus ruminantium]